MNAVVQIVDRGRGPQLSTSRITVQDLVPYFQRKCTHEEILDSIPVLTEAELQVVERYVEENYEAVIEQDRRIRERNAQRTTPPEVEEALRRGGEKMAALRIQFDKAKQERNGDCSSR